MRGRLRELLVVATVVLGFSASVSWAQSASFTVSVTVVRPCTLDVSPAAPDGHPAAPSRRPPAVSVKCGTRPAFSTQSPASGTAVIPGAPAPAVLSWSTSNTQSRLAIDF